MTQKPSLPAPTQKEAQTALLIAVIRATPNEVFFTIAKDFVIDACSKVATFFWSAVEFDASPTKQANVDTCCPRCRSRNKSFLQSTEFMILKAFIKLVVKLYLTLILEVTKVALQLLG